MIAILDNIRSAQNVGSILRTCDAFGVQEVYLCGITPDSSNRKVLKTSLGAEKNINKHTCSSTIEAVEGLKKKGYMVVGLETGEKSKDISSFKTKEPFALVIGNEVSGISEDVQVLCDYLVEIPMKGTKESLNVSVAFGIAAYHLTCKA